MRASIFNAMNEPVARVSIGVLVQTLKIGHFINFLQNPCDEGVLLAAGFRPLASHGSIPPTRSRGGRFSPRS